MYNTIVTKCDSPLRLCKHCYVQLRRLQPMHIHESAYCMSSVQSRNASSQSKPPETDIRSNPVHIQMISDGIHQQVFKDVKVRDVGKSTLDKVTKHLKAFDLWDKKMEKLEKIDFKLPSLLGGNIDEHFQELALRQSKPYLELVNELLTNDHTPKRPDKWKFQRGWVRYDGMTMEPTSVPYPQEDGVVFDVEVLMADGNYPTIATAVSAKAWYAWCSDRLFDDVTSQTSRTPGLKDLIPMETEANYSLTDTKWHPCLVIGHNVGFDRTFIKEQYYIQGTRLRFLDTMSMHIAVSGLTSLQRILYMANKTGSRRKEVVEHEQDRAKYGQTASVQWLKESTLNNLSDVYQLYCKGPPLNKDIRSTFIDGTIQDVKDQFQDLMDYCASDVEATLSVFKQLWPQFHERFPHPVTLAGMLEMGTAYLPINRNWQRYIDQAQTTYDDLQQEMNQLLQRLADDACGLLDDNKYKEDVWLWDVDWTVRNLKYKKTKTSKKTKQKNEDDVEQMTTAAKELAAKQPHMPGYPRWYAELCPKDWELDAGAAPGPSKITTQQRITPKLLNLTWDGYPLHYDATHGWGYLVPKVYRDEVEQEIEEELDRQEDEESRGDGERKKSKAEVSKSDFPIKSLLSVVAETRPEWARRLQGYDASRQKADALLSDIHKSTGEENGAEIWSKYKEATKHSQENGQPDEELQPKVAQPGVGPYPDVVPGCDFYRLPHKDGANKRVGNPLAKDFLSKIEEGVLKSRNGSDAEIVLKCSKMCSYWKNNMDRIRSQMAVHLEPEELPDVVTSNPAYDAHSTYGAILPRVVTAGTVTRRAVEATWLTASNAYVDRVGSEMKAMIQIPPGFHFVGADVDSQELWIASVLGDAYFAGLHGCTALSWMTLQGNKADGTDLHSRTAALVDITRDQAKVFNYGRIYGAGVRFAEQLLKQFNHRLTTQEARSKAKVMYKSTKGKKVKVVYDEHELDTVEDYIGHQWTEGSESSMFNMLEKIAVSKEPKTPVLGCKISKTLEPRNVADDFMTSRVNWVVQSSAVDYLHLMLVCMRWLLETFEIDGRFCISIHDEVRYIVRSEDRYRAALALQVTNLLTRAMFAYKLGMNDLPQSVAFFSAVDIDTCLRKEVVMDCVTPSNPQGLAKGYNMPPGEALKMSDILNITNGSLSAASLEISEDDVDDMLAMSRHLI